MSKSDYQNLKEAYLSNVKPIRENYGRCMVDYSKPLGPCINGKYNVPHKLIGQPNYWPWVWDIYPKDCSNISGNC